MRNNKFFNLYAILLSILTFTSAMFASPGETPRKIIVFQKSFSNKAAQVDLIKKTGAIPIKPLKIINGMAVYLPEQAQSALEEHLGAEIVRIDEDIIVHGTAPGGGEQPLQELPWGIDRIEADIAWGDSNGTMVNVAILDTGANLDHLDLIDNIKGNYNAISSRKSAADDHGHGTHVTGIIGAVNNAIGVVGVGPQVNLYPVKVLDRKNEGFLSDIVDGMQWCIDNNMQVINMSFGSLATNQAYHDAFIAVHNAGIVQVAAAGNTGGAILYPAKYPETIAVSSVDLADQLAASSARGAEIDLAAPGVGINSTAIDGLYTTMSGTSMAAPHVTGAVALLLATDGTLTPSEVKVKLKNTAEDLGLPTIEQGAGLIRADLAIQ
ncbi:S8 family peptidase [Sulfurovum sp. XTW-4]|uniref:S8 family peptidase n=1 Tax=Sulfurovum xiamenensis TaxID=3019066 RepID=A0ABT7QPM8_9BACT|nr:S8 family peptidase [Sulfurovum xiamenensis]MDM5263033.1 S8 family peptidase [Sulfurovum xiamenensis]